MKKFDFDERIDDIEQTLKDLTLLKNNSSNLFSISQSLIETIEDSLVIAIYSLSEQMLKHIVYQILDVCFEQDLQEPKDIYILKQMPPSSYAMTPSIKRIKSELKPYGKQFELYIPQLSNPYKEAYENLIKARHEYAHANCHTEQINFKDALEFVKYLRAFYFDYQNNGFSKELIKIINQLKFLKLSSMANLHTSIQQNLTSKVIINYLDELFDKGSHIIEILGIEREVNIYDIVFLNDIYDSVKEIFEIFDLIDEDNFTERISTVKDLLKNL